MYAVFRSGGKQYRGSQGDRLKLEKIQAEEGASVNLRCSKGVIFCFAAPGADVPEELNEDQLRKCHLEDVP